MKCIIKMACSISLILLLHSGLGAQQNVDSLLLESYNAKIGQIENYQQRWLDQKVSFEELSKGFCFLNKMQPEKANDLLDLSLRPSFLPKDVTYKFLKDIFPCLDDKQAYSVKVFLTNNMLYSEAYYHELVSLYQLHSQEGVLELYIRNKSILDDLKDQMKKGAVDQSTVDQLRNMATLANIGHENYEDLILKTIKELYDESSLDNRYFKGFYKVFNSTVPFLYSKKSVVETLYLLDQEMTASADDHSDMSGTTPDFSYFLSCIQPKLKDAEIEIMAWTDFEKNKEKIKDLILNDNSIWLEHIKLENK